MMIIRPTKQTLAAEPKIRETPKFQIGSMSISSILFRWAGARVSRFLSPRNPSIMDESPRVSPCLLMLPPAGGDKCSKLYSPAEGALLKLELKSDESLSVDDDNSRARIVGSSFGWLALLYRRNPQKDLLLQNPVSGQQIKLPPLNSFPVRSYNHRRRVFKSVISSSPEEDGCRALASFGLGRRPAFCCPGRPTTEWTPIGVTHDVTGIFERHYEDFLYSAAHKLFFCLVAYAYDTTQDLGKRRWPFLSLPLDIPPCKLDVEGWDLSDPLSPRIDWVVKGVPSPDDGVCCPMSPEPFACRHPQYLVFAEHSDNLYLVTRHVVPRMSPDGYFVKHVFHGNTHRGWDHTFPYKTVGFDVYKVDRTGGKLILMKGHLDGLAMFIGSTDPFALPAHEFPKLKSNSIYFADENLNVPPANVNFGGHDNGIFNYKFKTFSSCFNPWDYQSIRRIIPPPIWFIPSSIKIKNVA